MSESTERASIPSRQKWLCAQSLNRPRRLPFRPFPRPFARPSSELKLVSARGEAVATIRLLIHSRLILNRTGREVRFAVGSLGPGESGWLLFCCFLFLVLVSGNFGRSLMGELWGMMG